MKLTRFAAVLIAGAMLLAACGGGDDGSEAAADTGGPTGATTGGDTGGGGVGIFDSAECAEAVGAWSAAAIAAGAAATDSTADLEQSIDQLEAFAAAAPEEIRDDLTLVYQAYGDFVAAMQASGYDPSSGTIPTEDQIAALEEASQSLQGADIEAASENVSAWFDENCGA